MEGFEEPRSVNLESSYSDELPKRRPSQQEYSHIIHSVAFDVAKMAQDVVSGQGFLCGWMRTQKRGTQAL